MFDVDMAIIGAGPAGSLAGLVLASRYRVILADRVAEPSQRIGESLVPAARRILRDLDLLTAFERLGFPAYLGNRSVWGGTLSETDFMRDPDGPGWHLDRAEFERFLRAAAIGRGCRLIAPARLQDLERSGDGWRVKIADGSDALDMRCRVVIDATGRAASVTKRLGIERSHPDRLSARWIRGEVRAETSATAGFSMVESTPDGWWYSAPLSDGRRVLSFQTDADLMAASGTNSVSGLIEHLRSAPALGNTLEDIGFAADGTEEIWTTAAHTSVIGPVAGPGWLAVGDAALAMDPLSSRGIFNALYTGMTGAAAAAKMLAGDEIAADSYAADLKRIHTAYNRHLAVVYGAETRWQDAPFWQRRGPAAAQFNDFSR